MAELTIITLEDFVRVEFDRLFVPKEGAFVRLYLKGSKKAIKILSPVLVNSVTTVNSSIDDDDQQVFEEGFIELQRLTYDEYVAPA